MSTGTLTRPDDILFAPISGWPQLCQRIIKYIQANRYPKRMHFSLNRLRPPNILGLHDFAEAYHDRGQTKFWRVVYPGAMIEEFEFDGDILEAGDGLFFPAYGVVGYDFYRSIEDANLVLNTYTHDYIFGSHTDASLGISFLSSNYP